MKEYAKVAAKWWADRLRNVGPANFNNGDQTERGGMAMMMATLLGMDKQAPKGNIDQFEEQLAQAIEENVEKNGDLTISCDYQPCCFLADIADECGVDTFNFPWKTVMWVEKDKVTVRFGYGAAPQTIFGE